MPPEVAAYLAKRHGNWFMTWNFRPGWGYRLLCVVASVACAVPFVCVAGQTYVQHRLFEACIYSMVAVVGAMCVYEAGKYLWCRLMLFAIMDTKERKRMARLNQLTGQSEGDFEEPPTVP